MITLFHARQNGSSIDRVRVLHSSCKDIKNGVSKLASLNMPHRLWIYVIRVYTLQFCRISLLPLLCLYINSTNVLPKFYHTLVWFLSYSFPIDMLSDCHLYPFGLSKVYIWPVKRYMFCLPKVYFLHVV